ncbi:hypothetical protein [Viscerimonas tarda]
MPDTTVDDGYIFGLDEVIFNGRSLGYIDENGLAAGGDAPSTTKIRAAQKRNAVVKVLLTTPGSKTFTANIIQLKPADFKDAFGGTIDAETNVYSAPAEESIQEGALQINCSSGHTITAPKVSLTANLAGAINLAQTLQIVCSFEIMVPDDGGSPWQNYPPGEAVPEA